MQLGDDLKKDKTPKVFLGPQRILHRDAVTYVSYQLTCESLHHTSRQRLIETRGFTVFRTFKNLRWRTADILKNRKM